MEEEKPLTRSGARGRMTLATSSEVRSFSLFSEEKAWSKFEEEDAEMGRLESEK